MAGELLIRIVVASYKFRLFLSQVLPQDGTGRLTRKVDSYLADMLALSGNWLLPIPCVVRQVNRLQQESMILVSQAVDSGIEGSPHSVLSRIESQTRLLQTGQSSTYREQQTPH